MPGAGILISNEESGKKGNVQAHGYPARRARRGSHDGNRQRRLHRFHLQPRRQAGYQEVSPGAAGVQPRHRRADLHDLEHDLPQCPRFLESREVRPRPDREPLDLLYDTAIRLAKLGVPAARPSEAEIAIYNGHGSCFTSWWAHHRVKMTSNGSSGGAVEAGPHHLSNHGCNFSIYLEP
jgi:hypothetical protein